MSRLRVLRGLFLVGVSALCATLVGAGRAPEEAVIQPMVFNHKAHKDAEIECLYCHGGAASHDGAGIPRIQDCADCHAGIDNEGKEGAKIAEWAERGIEPPWQALFVIGKWNRFSHKAHARKNVGCETCHGDIGASLAPPTSRRVYEMEWCMDCHQAEGASNDCLVCHK